MTKIAAPVSESKMSNGFPADIQEGVDNHKKAAHHLEEAAKHYHEAAKHHEAGNLEQACISTVKAQGHSCCAGDHQKEFLNTML